MFKSVGGGVQDVIVGGMVFDRAIEAGLAVLLPMQFERKPLWTHRAKRKQEMASYTKSEARAWAREKMVGVVQVTIPTMASDFKRINEKAIRHDVRLAKEHGFIGSLAVSEVPMFEAEHDQFQKIMGDEAGKDFVVVHHAVFNTMEDNIVQRTGRGLFEMGHS